MEQRTIFGAIGPADRWYSTAGNVASAAANDPAIQRIQCWPTVVAKDLR